MEAISNDEPFGSSDEDLIDDPEGQIKGQKNSKGPLVTVHKSAETIQGQKLFAEIQYFVFKIVLTYCEKKLFTDREKNLKFKAEGQAFAKILRSLEQFIQTVKGQNNFW